LVHKNNMYDDQIQIVSPPQIDALGYGNSIFDFLISIWPSILEGLQTTVGFLVGISIPISIMLFIGIIVAVERLRTLREKESEYYNPKMEEAYTEEGKVDPDVLRKWKQVQDHLESQNPNDWRQAILEADIMLGDLLNQLGYRGESIGEQLKRVEKGDFLTINDAWEAHKVRNQLAHAGSDYPFSQQEARQVIGMYRRVFEEFMYI
jgi:hypothetical protein